MINQEGDAEFFAINIQPSWHHFTRHPTFKGHVQRSVRPEAVLGPNTTGRPHKIMDKIDKGFMTSEIQSTKKCTNV